MSVQTTALPNMRIPPKSNVSVHIEVNTDINISAFTARRLANQYLLTWLGDQVGALTPELVVGDAIYWRLPVQYAPSRLGPLGTIGHIVVDAQTGEVSIGDGRSSEDMAASAEALYERTALSAGA